MAEIQTISNMIINSQGKTSIATDNTYSTQYWFGQSNTGSSPYNNNLFIDIDLQNIIDKNSEKQKKIKNIKNLSFSLTYRKQYEYQYQDYGNDNPMRYYFIILLYGYNNLNDTMLNNFNNYSFLIFKSTGGSSNVNINTLYYGSGEGSNYQPTDITLPEVIQLTGDNHKNSISTNKNVILFEPRKNLQHSSHNSWDENYLDTTTFNFNNLQITTKYCRIFIGGPMICQITYPYDTSRTNRSRFPLELYPPNAQQYTTDITITGEPLATPIQIPASWSGDIIKAEDSLTKDFQRLDSILQALQNDEYGWKVISDYPTNPALMTPTQYNTFITANYARPLQKIYELCLPYEATEYNNETSEYKACYTVRHLGNPTQFSVIPKLDVYYNALKELFPDCFEIEAEEQEENG